jgi:hypothetical protein
MPEEGKALVPIGSVTEDLVNAGCKKEDFLSVLASRTSLEENWSCSGWFSDDFF